MSHLVVQKPLRMIGVPLDLGAGHRGVDMGPSAIRVAGLVKKLRDLGYEVTDCGDLDTHVAGAIHEGDPAIRFFEPVFAVNQILAAWVRQTIEAGEFPIVLGGDHSLAIGSLAGAATALGLNDRPLGVIWIDAHADMNVPESSPSGNIHGMGLAASLGRGHPDFVNLLSAGPKLRPEHVSLVAIRNLDPPERAALKEINIRVHTMREIDESGMFDVMRRAIAEVSKGTAGIYVQFDMDSIDPEVAPGTGTPVPGGLSYREAHLAMEMLASEAENLVGVDIVETNPALDTRNKTGQLAMELILSLMGKTIFR